MEILLRQSTKVSSSKENQDTYKTLSIILQIQIGNFTALLNMFSFLLENSSISFLEFRSLGRFFGSLERLIRVSLIHDRRFLCQ